MYEAPKIERYGTFRELTEGGGVVDSDLFTADGTDGCIERRGPDDSLILCDLSP